MPYFKDLETFLREVNEWADLRHEQGVVVAPKTACSRSDLQKLRAEFQRKTIPASARRRDANHLRWGPWILVFAGMTSHKYRAHAGATAIPPRPVQDRALRTTTSGV
jgi:hypothetical protein